MIKYPLNLCRRKIGVYNKSRLLLEFLCESFFFQRIARICCAAALPYNCMVYGNSCVSVPHNRGLALIGDTNRCNILRGSANHIHRLDCNAKLACPDFVRIVLHPAGLGEILGKFPLRHAADLTLFIK